MRLFFLALLVLLTSVSAGNIYSILYNPATSSYGGTEGLFLNSSAGIWQSFAYDDFSDASLNTSLWAVNTTGNSTITEGNSGTVRILDLTAGGAGGDLVNLTLTTNLNRSRDVNVTFFLMATPTLSEVRITNGVPGATTLYQQIKPIGLDVPSRVYVSIYFNFTNHSVSYTQAGSLLNTINVTNYAGLYLQLKAEQGSNAQYGNYVNATEQVVLNEAQFTSVPAFIFYSNGSVGGGGNVSGFTNIGTTPLGSTAFSTNIKNNWQNVTYSVPVDGTYYYLVKSSSLVNNASLFFRVFDVSSLQLINFSVSLENSTNSTIYSNYSKTFWSNWSGIPNGRVTISLQNYSYSNYYYPQGRTFYFNDYPQTSSPSYQNLTFYMQPQSVTTGSVLINVVSTAGSPISSATVQLYRTINGVSTLVDQGVTATDGTTGFFVDKVVQYTLIVSAAGYPTSTSTTTFFGDTYTVVLGNGGQSNYSGFYYNMSVVFQPQQSYINVNYTNSLDFNVTINNTNCVLTNYTFTLRNTTSQVYSQFGTQSCGDFLNYTLNTTPFVIAGVTAETYNATLVIYSNGFPPQTISQFYVVQFTIPTGVEAGLRKIASVSTPWWNTIVAILASLLLTLFFSKYIGFGSGLITLISLGIFAYYGMIDGGMFMVSALVLVALLIGGRYILS